jgi:DNA-binding CsgD family transcriptional regulator
VTDEPLIGYEHLLTVRQTEILRLAAQGHSRSRISQETGIGQQTVNCHLYAVYKRLGVNGRMALGKAITEARRLGILEPE